MVRIIKPPSRFSGSSPSKRLRRCSRSSSSSMRCDTPMWSWCGKNTKKRPAMLISVVSRAPLVPIGSLITCTMIDWPSCNTSWIGRSLGSSPPIWHSIISAACKNAARCKPISTNADCIPGSTRHTLPRYTLPTIPNDELRSICSSCAMPCSITATRVSCGVTLINISCPKSPP